MALWAAIPALAGLAGSLFGKKKEGGETITADQMIPGFQKNVGENLSKWISQYMSQFVPGEGYGGKMTAGMSPQETSGMSILDKFLSGSSLGELFGAGKGQIMDTLSGKFARPESSPFIQSMTRMSQRNLEDQINQARGKAGARGSYYTDSALREEKDLGSRTMDYLNSIIGQFIGDERNRMFQAAPIAQGMDEYENVTAPLSKVQASQSLGSLSRVLEQGDLERKYQDFLRKRGEMAMPITQGQQLYSTQQPYGLKSVTMPQVETNNPLGNIMDMISKLNVGALGGSGNIWDKLGGLFKG